MNTEFWKNKKVLITGHNGFKGCWLTKWLDMAGACVTGFSLPAEGKSGINELKFSKGFSAITGDIRNRDTVNSLKEEKPEIIFHLAAQAIVSSAKEDPVTTFETNCMGTVNLLQMLRQTPSVKAIVVVTSDKVYENIETTDGYGENSPLMGQEPYSCSKVCEEQVAKAYYESYFKESNTGVAVARGSNAFGGGDYHFDRLIPYLEKCAFYCETPAIRNPVSVRPWQYVLDLLHGYIVLAEHLYKNPDEYSGSWNFGPERKELYTVGEMSGMICGNAVIAKKQDYYEAGLLFINSDKSKKFLNWTPVYTTKKAIEETTLAYSDYFKEGNSNKLYENRINEYINAINIKA